MSLVTAPSGVASTRLIATVIVGVLASSAFLAWMAWRVSRSAERAERDPKYLRRRLMRWGMLYFATVVIIIVEVATGDKPKAMLLGLPITALIAWWFLRAAVRVKVPPTSR
jgi:hypothetical protein